MIKYILSLILLASCICNAECNMLFNKEKKIITIENNNECSVVKFRIGEKFQEEGEEWISVDVCYELYKKSNDKSCSYVLDFYDEDDFPVSTGKMFYLETKVSAYFTGKLHTQAKFKVNEFRKIRSYKTYTLTDPE